MLIVGWFLIGFGIVLILRASVVWRHPGETRDPEPRSEITRPGETGRAVLRTMRAGERRPRGGARTWSLRQALGAPRGVPRHTEVVIAVADRRQRELFEDLPALEPPPDLRRAYEMPSAPAPTGEPAQLPLLQAEAPIAASNAPRALRPRPRPLGAPWRPKPGLFRRGAP